jgi:hypothetical protein
LETTSTPVQIEPDDDGILPDAGKPFVGKQDADPVVYGLAIDIPWPGQSLMEAFGRNVFERHARFRSWPSRQEILWILCRSREPRLG